MSCNRLSLGAMILVLMAVLAGFAAVIEAADGLKRTSVTNVSRPSGTLL